MRRFFVDKVNMPKMVLGGDECKHIVNVLRFKVGDELILCPNDGSDYLYKIHDIGKKELQLEFISQEQNDSEAAVNLTVYFGMLKGDKSEFVVTKLTELGVKNIVPYVSKFTVKVSNKTDRLVRASVEACKQCGRATLPNVHDILSFDKMTSELSQYDKVVFAYEDAYWQGERLSNTLTGDEKSVALIIGSEGGFDVSEVQTLRECGVNAVTLGKRILRAETASIVASGVILYICGEWE